MKKLLGKGKVIVSLVSVFAILAVSLLSMFTGVTFVANAADGEGTGETATYPLNGKWDASYVPVETPVDTYVSIDPSVKTEVSKFDGFATDFLINSETVGKGTAKEPYIIKTANQFAAVVTGNLIDDDGNYIKTDGLYFKVDETIKEFDLSNTDATDDFSGTMTAEEVESKLKDATVTAGLDWNPKYFMENSILKGGFAGIFDGNGVTVYGLKAVPTAPPPSGANAYNQAAGIFPLLPARNVIIRNLTVKNCYFEGKYASALIGYQFNEGVYVDNKIENCAVYNNVVLCNDATNDANDDIMCRVGVLYGYTNWQGRPTVTADNCLVYGNIAKHKTVDTIKYSLIGMINTGNYSTGFNNCIMMDTAPYNVRWASHAFTAGFFDHTYTNMVGSNSVWSNSTENFGYTYKYLLDETNTYVTEKIFTLLNKSTGVSADYKRDVESEALTETSLFYASEEDIKNATEIAGIDPEKWDYNEGSYPTPKIYYPLEYMLNVYTKGDTWTGEIAYNFIEGNGTQDTPYEVGTAEEFALMLTKPVSGAQYKLTADINLNDTTDADWTKNARKWFTSNDVPEFNAVLDGNGHTVRGLYYDGTHEGEYAGLIPVIGSGALIKNITVEKSEINADKGAAAAVIGTVGEKCQKVVKVNAVTVKDTVKFGGKADMAGVIGRVGYSVMNMESCISLSNGLVGVVIGDAKVKNSISAGAYPFAKCDNVRPSNVYTDTKGQDLDGVILLDNAKMKGDAAATNMTGLDFVNSWKVVANDYPAPTGVAASAMGVVGEAWSGAVAPDFARGQGTEDDPYIIETAEQLALLVYGKDRVTFGGLEMVEYYKLGADIYVNDVKSNLWSEKIGCNEWYSQRTTKTYNNISHMNFDGDGHVVYGLFYDHSGATKDYVAVALFPVVGSYVTIQNVGISDAYLVGVDSKKVAGMGDESMAALIGRTDTNYGVSFSSTSPEANAKLKADNPEIANMMIRIKNCFVDHRSYFSACNTGGFVGNPNVPISLENCIFTGSIKGDPDNYWKGIFVGLDWGYSSELKNCISFPVTAEPPLVSGTSGHYSLAAQANWITTAENVYYFSPNIAYGGNYTKYADPNNFLGTQATEYLLGLDWAGNTADGEDDIWRSVEGGTPVLTVFDKWRSQEETNYFSRTDFVAPYTTLTFSTGDPDVNVDTIRAPMYSKLTLPTPVRFGYKFTGWYVYDDPAILYDLGYHPARDLTLFAGWEKAGITQDFEEYPETMWDYDENCWALNRPGVKGGYKVDYIRGGGMSMHLLGTNTEPSDCLLNYEEMLTPGKSYTMALWVTTDKADNPETLLSLVHNSKPDYYNSAVAVENMTVVKDLTVGEWTKYTYSFTAQTKWISLRATGGSSLWFDDIVVAELDEAVSGNGFINLGTNGSAGGALSPNTGDCVSVAVLISAIMACAVIAVVSRKNLVEVVED